MTAPGPGLPAIDRLVHEPVRMALLSVLDGVAEADFAFLQRTLRLTQGNLSAHLTKLEGGGLVVVTKSFQGRTPRTTVQITASGHDARVRHWSQLEALRALSGSVDRGRTPAVG
jgi:DNA-binding transcriptional ArsR family regulator